MKETTVATMSSPIPPNELIRTPQHPEWRPCYPTHRFPQGNTKEVEEQQPQSIAGNIEQVAGKSDRKTHLAAPQTMIRHLPLNLIKVPKLGLLKRCQSA